MRYDPLCLDLAEHFLEQPGRVKDQVAANRAHRLAGAIQECIEAWIEDEARDVVDAQAWREREERDDD